MIYLTLTWRWGGFRTFSRWQVQLLKQKKKIGLFLDFNSMMIFAWVLTCIAVKVNLPVWVRIILTINRMWDTLNVQDKKNPLVSLTNRPLVAVADPDGVPWNPLSDSLHGLSMIYIFTLFCQLYIRVTWGYWKKTKNKLRCEFMQMQTGSTLILPDSWMKVTSKHNNVSLWCIWLSIPMRIIVCSAARIVEGC